MIVRIYSMPELLADRLFSYACSLQYLSEVYNAIFIRKAGDPVTISLMYKLMERPTSASDCMSTLAGDYKTFVLPCDAFVCCAVGSPSLFWIADSPSKKYESGISSHRQSRMFVCDRKGVISSKEIFPSDEKKWLRKYFSVSFIPSRRSVGIPRNRKAFAEDSNYILSSQLGSRLVLRDEETVSPVGVFKGAERIYLKSDCIEVRTWREWLSGGRIVQTGLTPKGFKRIGSKSIGLYSVEQTRLECLNRIYPDFSDITECCDEANFMECSPDQTACLNGTPYMWATTCLNGKHGICVYKGHLIPICNKLTENSLLPDASKKLLDFLDFWAKLFRRILIDRLVETHYISKK